MGVVDDANFFWYKLKRFFMPVTRSNGYYSLFMRSQVHVLYVPCGI